MTEVDELIADVLVAASVTEAEGHPKLCEAFLGFAQKLQLGGTVASQNKIPATSTSEECNT